MTATMYVEIGTFGALKRVIGLLQNDRSPAELRIAQALEILEPVAARALVAPTEAAPVDLVAIVPADDPDAADTVGRAIAAGELVELTVPGRLVGILPVEESTDAA